MSMLFAGDRRNAPLLRAFHLKFLLSTRAPLSLTNQIYTAFWSKLRPNFNVLYIPLPRAPKAVVANASRLQIRS